MATLQRKVLLLNQAYAPINIVGWRKASDLVLWRQKAQIVHEYADGDSMFNASVISLVVRSPNPHTIFDKQRFSKRNVFLRDQFSCQYCAKAVYGKELTIDHIVPRALGGRTSYLNCVTACKKCNAIKADKPLEKTELKLINPVRRPNIYDLFVAGKFPGEWSMYIKLD